MEESQKDLLELLKEGITPATGCTEPIAVAYAVAAAKEQIEGNLESIHILVDSNIYKNGLMVTIPGTREKGLVAAAAFGFIAGDIKRRFRVIEGLTDKDIVRAKDLIEQKKIELSLKRDCTRLDIEVTLLTDKEKVRINILDNHLNIVNIEKIDLNSQFKPLIREKQNANSFNHQIQKYTLEDFLQFSNETPLEDLMFLEDGIKMNMKIAQEGLTIKSGVGAKFTEMINEGIMSDNMVTRAQVLCAAASEARMSGSKLPVMSTAGSGNHGITVFLTSFAVAEKKNLSKEKLIRSLALSNLITFFIKSYTGTLSAMCGCGVAAGIGASAGIIYLLDGNKKQILGALYNMVGSISGMICDGAKDGCSYKLALASGWTVQSALLALKGAIINSTDGIIDPDFKQLFKNLGYVCDPGMVTTDQKILDTMLHEID
ncbi:MAG TPA: serine dehydratase subunit alpha family protein [Candidatus Atribacteria bacterium]|nr:serine dehydratase subunit alpha family protein [Candidatus Atribacteria bacterium]